MTGRKPDCAAATYGSAPRDLAARYDPNPPVAVKAGNKELPRDPIGDALPRVGFDGKAAQTTRHVEVLKNDKKFKQ